VHLARFEAGLPPGAHPFGWYRPEGARGIEAHPDEAPIVAEMYRRYLAGEALRSLALDLNRRGIPTRRGGPWAADSLRYLLDSPIHAGLVTLNGETRPGQHDGVIDERTRAAYLAARRRGRAAPRRVESPYLLSGLIFCSICQRPMAGNSGGARRTRWPQYRCSFASATAAHPAQTISTRKADGEVVAWLADRAAGINEAAANLPAVPVSVPDVGRLAERIEAIDRKLAALLLRELDGTPATVHELARADLAGKRAGLVEQVEAEQERQAIASTAPRQAALDLLEHWDLAEIGARREALRALIRRVVVHYRPGRVVIEPQLTV
jgi:site-specific DNA recombinase